MTALPLGQPHLDGDRLLAERCAARDPLAIREVLTANNQRLFRAAWSILKDRDEAEEAVQSAYLHAFAGMREFAGRSSLSTWLTRIVINEALGRLRSNRRRETMLEAQGVVLLNNFRETMMMDSTAGAPDSELARAQLRSMIEKAVAALPDEFRTVYVLRDIEELSGEETAAALGIPVATVKTRLHRARRRLQQLLEPDVRLTLGAAFPFAGADCERLTARVMESLGL